jgi:hypothetical protein
MRCMERLDRILLVFLGANGELVKVRVTLAPAALNHPGHVPAVHAASLITLATPRGSPKT